MRTGRKGGSARTVSGCRLEWGGAGSPGSVGWGRAFGQGGGAGGGPQVDIGLEGLGGRVAVRLQACEHRWGGGVQGGPGLRGERGHFTCEALGSLSAAAP